MESRIKNLLSVECFDNAFNGTDPGNTLCFFGWSMLWYHFQFKTVHHTLSSYLNAHKNRGYSLSYHFYFTAILWTLFN